MKFKLLNKKFLGEKNVSEKSNILLDKINDVFKNKDIIKYCDKLSKASSIPKKEIIFYFKKQYFNSYNFKKYKFDNKIFLFSIIKYFFVNFFFIVAIFFLKKKNNINTLKKYDLLIDDVSDPAESIRYNNLKSYSKDYAIRVNKNFFLYKKTIEKKKFHDNIYRKNYHNYNLSIKDLLFLIRMTYWNIIYSFKTKINLYYFFIKLINDYYFFSSFFEDYKFKHIISSRHYVTNNIKNYISKKNDTKSYVIQKNIDTENQIGFFCDSDVLFIIGNKTKIKKKRFCNFKKQIPVGSFIMEYLFYSKTRKKNKIVKQFDILCLGGNQQFPGGEFDNDKNHASNYVEHLNWLKKISIEFPKLKVGFKHHTNNKNNFENYFFRDSNVVYIENTLNTYELCNKAKFICSWASTMIIELPSINKRGFFLDPNYQNIQYMKNINKNIRINTYEKLKNFYFKPKYKEKINFNNYCMNSRETSFRIFNYLFK